MYTWRREWEIVNNCFAAQKNYRTGKSCKTIFQAALQREINSQFSRLYPPSFLDFVRTANYNVLLHTSKILEVLPTTKTKEKQTMPRNKQKYQKNPTKNKTQPKIKTSHTQYIVCIIHQSANFLMNAKFCLRSVLSIFTAIELKN